MDSTGERSYCESFGNQQTPSTPSSSDSNDASISRASCKVCGDTGIGFNFGVRTCESCKAFFRRNANRPTELKCAFTDGCQINKFSRKFCPKCRLHKCFDVGMRKELILSEEDKVHKRFRRKKTSSSCDSEEGTASTRPNIVGECCFPAFDESTFQDFHSLVYSSNVELSEKVESNQELFDRAKLLDFVCQRAIYADFKYRNQRVEIESANEWNFNQIEMFKFDELRRTSVDLLPKDYCNDEQCATVFDTFKFTEVIITNLIKLVKQWAAFRILTIDEQISLLKIALIEMLCVWDLSSFRSQPTNHLFAYNAETQTRICLQTELIRLFASESTHQFIARFFQRASEYVEKDVVLINLMIALILFRPHDFPERRAFLESEYLVYLFILNQYLANICENSVVAKAKFLKILELVEECLVISRIFSALLDKIDSSQMSNFIKEVFNL